MVIYILFSTTDKWGEIIGHFENTMSLLFLSQRFPSFDSMEFSVGIYSVPSDPNSLVLHEWEQSQIIFCISVENWETAEYSN